MRAVPGVRLRRPAAERSDQRRLSGVRVDQGDRVAHEGGRHQVADVLGAVRDVLAVRVLLRVPDLVHSAVLAAEGKNNNDFYSKFTATLQ